ncbi:unnamed protein product [Parajaminaea phylloscopi]
MASTGSVYNHSRLTRQILRRHRKHPASFYLQLHPTWIRFEDSKGRTFLEEPIVPDPDSIADYAAEPIAGPSSLPLSASRSGESGALPAASGNRPSTPGKELLRCIREQQLPTGMLDILDNKRVPFFEGCLIVEIKDHRISAPLVPQKAQANEQTPDIDTEAPSKASLAGRIEGGRYGKRPANGSLDKQTLMSASAESGTDRSDGAKAAATAGPESYRIVLHPSEETLWFELRSLNHRLSGGTWSEQEGLEIESKILATTSAPLCLTPDPHASRIANLMLAATAPPSRYLPAKPLPHQRHLPLPKPPQRTPDKTESTSSEIDQQKLLEERAEQRRRETLMRLMEGGWKMTVKSKKNSGRTGQAQLPATINATGERPFTPTFHRLSFIEKYRAKNGKASGSQAAARSSTESAAGPTKTQAQAQARGDANAATAASPTSAAKEADAKGGASAGAKKPASKKRKKQEAETTQADEKEEASAAPKSKKKKTSAPNGGKAASPVADKKQGVEATSATSPKGAKAKAPKAKKGATKKPADTTADASLPAGSPSGDASTPMGNGDSEVGTAKGAKKPAGKKTPAKASKKATQDQHQHPGQNSASRQSTATPALHSAQLPTGSPHRQSAASPYGVGAVASPSPALSHAAIPSNVLPGNPNFVNLPFGLGMQPQQQPQQQQQQQQAAAAAAIAAQFGLPLGVGIPPGMQMGQGGQGALNLPFGQPQQPTATQQQHGGGLPMFNGGNHMLNSQQQQGGQQGAQSNGTNGLAGLNLNLSNPQAMAQTAAQLQSHPSFHNLPPHVQQQIMAWQRNKAASPAGSGQQNNAAQGQGQGQAQASQQQRLQQSPAGSGGGGGGAAHGQGGMFPPGWPMAQR